MDVLPAHLNRDFFRDSLKGLVALEIISDLPFGFPINNIIFQAIKTFLTPRSGWLTPPFLTCVYPTDKDSVTNMGRGDPRSREIPRTRNNPDRQRFSVPHPSRDPDILVDNKLMNEHFFHLIQNPPETGVVRVFENPEEWDTSKGSVKSITTQGEATIQMTSSPLHLD